ncbi:MAG: NAD(P)/FAD-dependent oxidoreductase [Candidatus Eiseniibacteriota bacterium]
MTQSGFDVIVVGARCAGSPTAMLLARHGYRTLVVDRATFPSDTISTHLIHPPGMGALRRWGLRDRVIATNCPPIDTYLFDFGAFTLSGAPGTKEEPVGYAPRRTVLDKILVDAASGAGAKVREDFVVDEVLFDGGTVTGIRGHAKSGASITERARIVVGADGRHSLVAQAVGAEAYREKPPLLAAYYTYWSNLPMDGRFDTYILPHRGMAAWPTNDGLTLLVAGWPYAEFESGKKDIKGNYLKVVSMAPAIGERIHEARREERFVGTPVENFFRKPYGPGWALVGDAGYNKDFITAQGITDAFRDAELCVTALHESFTGARPFDQAMKTYQEKRDAHVLPMYEFTTGLATLEPPPPEVGRVLAASAGNQEAMDGFARVNAGVTSPAEFFSEENVGRILTATH